MPVGAATGTGRFPRKSQFLVAKRFAMAGKLLLPAANSPSTKRGQFGFKWPRPFSPLPTNRYFFRRWRTMTVVFSGGDQIRGPRRLSSMTMTTSRGALRQVVSLPVLSTTPGHRRHRIYSVWLHYLKLVGAAMNTSRQGTHFPTASARYDQDLAATVLSRLRPEDQGPG
jgi:hypothetical protein